MKLRILGDSLRLRLSRGEVATMGTEGRVEDAIRFGPGARLVYALVAADVDAPRASFERDTITVQVPKAIVRAWVDSDQIGFDAQQDALRILVEKDFKCAVPREGEDGYDGFDNPASSC
jgi:hypothetical protein